ncbi:hypothetical protein GGR57DRAFT_506062 [Xylariaceae sp. FL1272]|nr:hypothetical protein GGR57DRAFT_506062 [Xylariaceae sp. FL1272]
MTSTAPAYTTPGLAGSQTSLTSTLPPEYSEHDTKDGHLAPPGARFRSSSTSSFNAPVSSGPFTPTSQLQIEAQGSTCTLTTYGGNTPIYSISSSGGLGPLAYLNIRPQRRSNSCYLTLADDPTETPITRTIYRVGPGRPPVIELSDPVRGVSLPGKGTDVDVHEAKTRGAFEVHSTTIWSRSITFEVPGLGIFGWRYAGSAEKKEWDAKSLLVCEVFGSSPAYHDNDGSSSVGSSSKKSFASKLGLGSSKDRESGTRIAQLVRNSEYRTPGSSRWSAGNGGRLMMDLTGFEEKEQERVRQLVCTTALTMLKRELERNQNATIAAIS